jgi:hypothetical protein
MDRKILGLLATVLITGPMVASAGAQSPHFERGAVGPSQQVVSAATTAPSVAAPEIDPASTVAGLTLLLGSLMVLRGRRAKPVRAV